MRLEGCLLIASLTALSVPAAAWGAPLYSEMIVFGDSVSDTGNVHIASTALGQFPDPGFDGRLSNGPIWIDRLAARLGLASPSPSLTGGTNYAYAGAKTGTEPRIRTSVLTREVLPIPNIGTQINNYLGEHLAGFRNDQLVVLWGGGNDLVATRTAVDTQRVVDNLEAELMVLDANGAGDVLVPNQIDQADAPIFNQTQGPAAQMAEVNRLFNTQLDAMLDDLDGNPALKIRIHRLDAFSLFKDVIADPGEFGLSNVTEAALNLAVIGPPFAQPYPVVDDPENYLFWDYVHPTTVGHRLIGDAAFDALAKDATQVPEPRSVALVIIGIAVSVWLQSNQRRRMKDLCPLHRNSRSI